MELILRRMESTGIHTGGKLYINGSYFCETLEDPERDIEEEGKVYGKTAIPLGRYGIEVTYSPKFKRMMPLIKDVPNFDGIRIHAGNTVADTDGCPMVGTWRRDGYLYQSRVKEDELTAKLLAAQNRKEEIFITVTH